jgi:SAM-dependent methyltransferase
MPPSRQADYDALDLPLIRARWDQKAGRWDADLADAHFHLNDDDAYCRFLADAETTVADRSEFCRGHLLVDLACGTGLILEHFLEHFAGGIGLDLSPRMLDMAAQRSLPGTQWVLGNCFELASHMTAAGAVFSRGILLSHYGPRWAPLLLRQVQQALVPDGGFAILDFLNAAARHAYPCNPGNKTYFHSAEIEALARAAGFRRARILGQPQRRVLLVLAEC